MSLIQISLNLLKLQGKQQNTTCQSLSLIKKNKLNQKLIGEKRQIVMYSHSFFKSFYFTIIGRIYLIFKWL